MRTSIFLIILFITASCLNQDKCNHDKCFHKEGLAFYVPKVNKILIDGKDGDWQGKGIECTLFSDYNGNMPYEKDFKASFCLAWCDSGFYVKLNVTDDSLFSASRFNNDMIELFLIDKVGGKNYLQYVITPDFTKQPAEVKNVFWDHRGTRKLTEIPIFISTAACKTDNGYCLEALIPFRIIGITPKAGDEIGFEIIVKDGDGNKDESLKVLSWNYLKDTYTNNLALNRILLTDTLSEKVNYSVKSYIQDHDSIFFYIFADKTNLGKKLTIKDSLKTYTESNINNIKNVFSFHVKDISEKTLEVYMDSILIGFVETDIVNLYFKNIYPYPFEDYVRFLKHKDKMQAIPSNPILFIGHSMFRYWQTFEDDMTGFDAINKAFGGSRAENVLHYFDQLVMPYKPKAIVYFEGANDFHSGVPAEKFMESVKAFAGKVHDSLPGTKLFIISPDIRNEHPEYNDKMKEFVVLHPDFIKYIDISDFKQKQGSNYQNLLMPDNTHWNAKGYAILAPIIREQIKEYKNKK